MIFIFFFFNSIGGKEFRQAKNLKQHVEGVHDGRKDYKCKHCGKEFSQSSTLNTHIKCVHEGIKNHVCYLCGKRFGIMGQLKRHVDSHQGIRRYKCQVCKFESKKFLKNKFLKKKLMNFILFFISTGDKAFSCPGKRKKHVKKMHPNAVWEGK